MPSVEGLLKLFVMFYHKRGLIWQRTTTLDEISECRHTMTELGRQV
ncbi:TPA: hypothetical protein ACX3IV_004851 [Vibrio parahaemolyticus]